MEINRKLTDLIEAINSTSALEASEYLILVQDLKLAATRLHSKAAEYRKSIGYTQLNLFDA